MVSTTTPTAGVTATVEGGTAAVIPLVTPGGRMGLMERVMDSRVEVQEKTYPTTSLPTFSSPREQEGTVSTVEEVEEFWSMVRDLQWKKARARATVEGGRDTGPVRDCRELSSWKLNKTVALLLNLFQPKLNVEIRF